MATTTALILATAALFDITERTSDGKDVAYPIASIVDVDVNSAVVVQLNRDALADIAGRQLGRPNPKLVTRLKQVAALTDQFNSVTAAVLAVAKDVKAAQASATPLDDATLKRLQSPYKALAHVEKDIRAYLVEYPHGADRFAAVVSDPKGEYVGIATLLFEETAALQGQVDGERTKLGVGLELAAWIGSPPVQVHVPGYDSIEPGEAHVVEKGRFVFDQSFKDEVSAAKDLATSAARTNSLKDAAEEALRKSLHHLADATKGLGDAAASLPMALDEAAKTTGVAATQFAQDARAATTTCGGVADGLKKLTTDALTPPANEDPGVALAGLIGGLQEQGSVVGQCLAAARTAIASWAQVPATPQAALAAAKGLIDRLGDSALTLMVSAIEAQPAGAPSLHVLAVSIDDAADSTISLLTANRNDGDVLEIRLRVLRTLGVQQVVAPGGEATRLLRVRSRGFVADTGGAVLWCRAIATGDALQPSATAYGVIRFKGWRSGGDADSNFFYTFAPGVGVAAVAIPTTDGTTQLSWMLVGQLFGDILQIGYGFTPKIGQVWGVGIGLHRIAGLGKTLR